jgi:hypothetical protein
MSSTASANVRSRLIRRGHSHGLVLSLALVATVGALAALPAAGSASAFGCTSSGFGIKGVSSAYTCMDLEGTPTRGGLWISLVHMSWSGAGTVCNYKWVVRYTNTSGQVYRTDSSAVHVGCRAVSAVWERDYGHEVFSQTYGWYWSGMEAQTGRVCGYLYESGSLRPGVPCESIHP